jgi:DNA-binding NarL/FixJ family response regulator
MIRLTTRSAQPTTVGIAIDSPEDSGAVARQITKHGHYEVVIIDQADIKRGSWPTLGCPVVITTPQAFQRRRDIEKRDGHHSPAIILALRRNALAYYRDKIAAADSFVLIDETLFRLSNLIPLARHGLSIMPRGLTCNATTIHRRLGRLQKLSSRDLQVLRELGSGQSNQVIARSLGISTSTAKVHARRVVERVGFRNRIDAAVYSALWYGSNRPTPFGQSV